MSVDRTVWRNHQVEALVQAVRQRLRNAFYGLSLARRLVKEEVQVKCTRPRPVA